jgi:hypothetical protein
MSGIYLEFQEFSGIFWSCTHISGIILGILSGISEFQEFLRISRIPGVLGKSKPRQALGFYSLA